MPYNQIPHQSIVHGWKSQGKICVPSSQLNGMASESERTELNLGYRLSG